MDKIIERLSELFSISKISNKIAEVVPDLLVVVIIILVFFVIWFILKKTLELIFSRSKLDITVSNFVLTSIKFIILVIGVITSLNQVGIDITAILTSLGILGLTIGFAAKDALSNIISGIFIFWDRPFVINDLIEIKNHYGRVEQITLRSTRIVTVDGKMLAIPNTTIVNEIVASYTNYPHLRIDVDVTVGLNENLAEVSRIILGEFENDIRFLKTPSPEVVVKELNDYNVKLELRIWIKNEREHIMARFEVRKRIFEILRNKGVEMPFETIQLAPFKMLSVEEKKPEASS